MEDNKVELEQILKAFEKMNNEVKLELLKIDQQSNRRLLAMETQLDSIEKKYASLEKDFKNFIILLSMENYKYLS